MARKILIKSGGRIRWAVSTAASEFGVSRELLTTAISRSAIDAGEDGKYSTQQICRAIFSDMSMEKLRLTREQADKTALINAAFRREYILVEDALILSRRLAFAIRQKIMASSMTPEERSHTLRDIQALADVDFTKLPTDDEELEKESDEEQGE